MVTAGIGSKSFRANKCDHGSFHDMASADCLNFLFPYWEMSRYPLSADGAGEVQGETSWGTRFVFDRLFMLCVFGGGSRSGVGI